MFDRDWALRIVSSHHCLYIFLSAAYLIKYDFPNPVPATTLLQSNFSERLTSVTSTNPAPHYKTEGETLGKESKQKRKM